MTRLQAGELVADFTLPSISGSMFNMSETRGKKVILTYFRFSSCPFCNLRISQLISRWDEFSNDIIPSPVSPVGLNTTFPSKLAKLL